MGVPKFYRWLSERYPCLSEVVKEYQIPEFDNLYLDMNGIIHICSHPNDDDPHFRISEEKIFQDIFHYIEFLFRMVQPRKVSGAGPPLDDDSDILTFRFSSWQLTAWLPEQR